jgi:hypothetical protein
MVMRYVLAPDHATAQLQTNTSPGVIAGLSLVGVPAALGVPGAAAPVWAGLYNHGKALMPKVAASVALSYMYAAYDCKRRTPNAAGIDGWKGYVAAGVLGVSIVPFTIVAMSPTNNKLLAVAAGASKLNAGDVSRLVDKWAALNVGRSLFLLASAAIGLATLLRDI